MEFSPNPGVPKAPRKSAWAALTSINSAAQTRTSELARARRSSAPVLSVAEQARESFLLDARRRLHFDHLPPPGAAAKEAAEARRLRVLARVAGVPAPALNEHEDETTTMNNGALPSAAALVDQTETASIGELRSSFSVLSSTLQQLQSEMRRDSVKNELMAADTRTEMDDMRTELLGTMEAAFQAYVYGADDEDSGDRESVERQDLTASVAPEQGLEGAATEGAAKEGAENESTASGAAAPTIDMLYGADPDPKEDVDSSGVEWIRHDPAEPYGGVLSALFAAADSASTSTTPPAASTSATPPAALTLCAPSAPLEAPSVSEDLPSLGMEFSLHVPLLLEPCASRIARDWQADEEATICFGCDSSFSFFNRRHHCRSCSRGVCDTCSQARRPIPPVYPEPVRVCVSCERASAAALDEVLLEVVERVRTHARHTRATQL
jgi:hypothetical protein